MFARNMKRIIYPNLLWIMFVILHTGYNEMMVEKYLLFRIEIKSGISGNTAIPPHDQQPEMFKRWRKVNSIFGLPDTSGWPYLIFIVGAFIDIFKIRKWRGNPKWVDISVVSISFVGLAYRALMITGAFLAGIG
jgi:hypothetical protein